MEQKEYTIQNEIELFPQKGGWHYVRVPQEITEEVNHLADRGLVAVTATVGPVTWDTSLLPMGDGSHFIALPARVRKANALVEGGQVQVDFKLRKR